MYNKKFLEIGLFVGVHGIKGEVKLKSYTQAPENIFLYEKSNKLIKIQKKRLISRKVSWITSLGKIEKGPVVFFGNEFLDALPIKQFKKIDNILHERFAFFKKNTRTNLIHSQTG